MRATIWRLIMFCVYVSVGGEKKSTLVVGLQKNIRLS
jgi:hypothetical protein